MDKIYKNVLIFAIVVSACVLNLEASQEDGYHEYLSRAISYELDGDTVKLKNTLSEMISLFPQKDTPYMWLANVYNFQDILQKSYDVLKDGIPYISNTTAVLAKLIGVTAYLGKNAEKESYSKLFNEKVSRNISDQILLLKVLNVDEKYHEIILRIERMNCSQDDGVFPFLQYMRGWAYYSLGEYEQAAIYLESSISSIKTLDQFEYSVSYFLALSLCHYQSGKNQAAKLAMMKAVNSLRIINDPTFMDFYNVPREGIEHFFSINEQAVSECKIEFEELTNVRNGASPIGRFTSEDIVILRSLFNSIIILEKVE